MAVEKYRHPLLFYSLSTIIPWALWFVFAYISHYASDSETLVAIGSILSVVGLAAPAVVAFWIILSDPDLRRDTMGRLFNFPNIKPVYLVLTCLLMLASILGAQAISLLFGHSVGQFHLAEKFSFSAGLFPAWFPLLAAPFLEELAWHSYGTDCLRQRFSLLSTSLIFAFYWGIWHFPLSFIKGYYHSNVAESGALYSINFIVSLFPYVLLMNWLYYKTGRNIIVAIVFHITASFFNEIFATHPDSKVIQTGLLTILAVVLVLMDRDFFLKREIRE